MTMATEKSRVLVVDDEPQITRVLRTVLTSQGYQVQNGGRGRVGADEFQRVAARAGDHGPLHAAHGRRRAVPAHPRHVERPDHRAVGQRGGADEGRSARLGRRRLRDQTVRHRRAARARAGDASARATATPRSRRSTPAISASTSRPGASTCAAREVRLTPKEFDLFVYMARHPNRVLTHRTLLEAVWGEASQEQPEYLRVFMGQLRKKLEPEPVEPAVSRHRTVGRLSIQPSRVKNKLGVNHVVYGLTH